MPRNHGLETNRFGTSDKKSFINQDEIARLPIFFKKEENGHNITDNSGDEK